MYGWVRVDDRDIDRWMECLGRDVNRMQCGTGWSGAVGLGRVMGG